MEHSISGTILFGPVEVPLIERRLYFKEKCFSCFPFSTEDTFFCHQEGTDTRIFYHAKILDQRLDIDTTVDAEDANVIIIAAYVSTTLQKKMI